MPYHLMTFSAETVALGRYVGGAPGTKVDAMKPEQDTAYVCDISSLRISDAEEAGGKGANMGELVAAKLPVPPGFVLLRDCYRDSMRAGGVDAELSALHREALANVADTAHLRATCASVCRASCKRPVLRTRSRTAACRVSRAGFGRRCRRAVLGNRRRRQRRIVRRDERDHHQRQRRRRRSSTRCCAAGCRCSRPRVITYRASRDFTADPAMAVVVQQMINSEKAGVAFTADPSNGAQDRVVIEGAFGLGEVVVSGEVEPDTYIVSKETLEPLDIRIGHKAFKIVRGPDGHDKVIDSGR